jgi:hypothetical protein
VTFPSNWGWADWGWAGRVDCVLWGAFFGERSMGSFFGVYFVKGGSLWPMSSERDSFAKGIFSTFAKGFLLHKLLLKVNFSPLRVKKSRSHDMGL